MDQVHAWYLSGPTLHLSLVIYIMLFQFSQSNNDALDNKLMVPRDISEMNDLCTDEELGICGWCFLLFSFGFFAFECERNDVKMSCVG